MPKITELPLHTGAIADDYLMVIVDPDDVAAADRTKKVLFNDAIGADRLHGIQAVGAYTFNATTKVFEIATVTGWYKGTKFTSAVALTCDLSSTADRDHASATLTTNTQYYVYFKDATGKLYWSPTAWDLRETAPVATIYWNGTAGAVVYEAHSHTRDLDWHINAHLTIGTRYYNGLALTAPTLANPTGLDITGGIIFDEDIAVTLANIVSQARLWYQVSAGVYTFTDITLPYSGTSGAPTFLDTDTYTLAAVGATNFSNYWVYASSDLDRPLYIIPTQAAASYNTSALARAEQPPVLQGVDISPEKKLIYRFIYKGNGDFIESTDYRKTSSLPSGAVAATSAAGVTFAPAGNIAATSVQGAIEELDSEKQALLVSGTNIKTINSTSLLGSGDIVVEGGGGAATGDVVLTAATLSPPEWVECSGGSVAPATYSDLDTLLGIDGVWDGTISKLTDPATLPTGQGVGANFSADGTYLAVAHITTPFITIYTRSGDTFTKLTDPATLPAGNGLGVHFSADGTYLAVAHSTTPFITIYKRSGDTFTKLTDPAALPVGNGYSANFSADGTYLAVAHITTPFITIYKRSGDTFTKLTDPAALPAGSAFGVHFSADGTYLAVAHSTTPFITIYKRSGDTFTKLTDPATLPGANGRGVHFTPDGIYLAYSSQTTPFITIYKRSGDTFTKLTDPATLPPDDCWDVDFSHSSVYLAVPHSLTPFIAIYKGEEALILPDLTPEDSRLTYYMKTGEAAA